MLSRLRKQDLQQAVEYKVPVEGVMEVLAAAAAVVRARRWALDLAVQQAVALRLVV